MAHLRERLEGELLRVAGVVARGQLERTAAVVDALAALLELPRLGVRLGERVVGRLDGEELRLGVGALDQLQLRHLHRVDAQAVLGREVQPHRRDERPRALGLRVDPEALARAKVVVARHHHQLLALAHLHAVVAAHRLEPAAHVATLRALVVAHLLRLLPRDDVERLLRALCELEQPLDVLEVVLALLHRRHQRGEEGVDELLEVRLDRAHEAVVLHRRHEPAHPRRLAQLVHLRRQRVARVVGQPGRLGELAGQLLRRLGDLRGDAAQLLGQLPRLLLHQRDLRLRLLLDR